MAATHAPAIPPATTSDYTIIPTVCDNLKMSHMRGGMTVEN
jgi:hypothetical protein